MSALASSASAAAVDSPQPGTAARYNAEQKDCIAWMNGRGAIGLDGLEARTSTLALETSENAAEATMNAGAADRAAVGEGVFAARDFKSGDMLCAVPRECAISHVAAMAMPRAQAMIRQAQKVFVPPDAEARGGTDSVVSNLGRYRTEDAGRAPIPMDLLMREEELHKLALWMEIMAAKADVAHEWNTWVKTCPEESPDICCWDEATRDALLKGTNAGASAAAVLCEMRDCYDELVAPLVADETAHGTLFRPAEKYSFEALMWARGMYISRFYPYRMLHGNDPEKCKTLIGVGLPFLDMFNHRDGQPICWEFTPEHAVFRAACDLKAGDEVFSNYGSVKSNEELLWSYGFCNKVDFEMDEYIMRLGCTANDPKLLAYKVKLLREADPPLPHDVKAAGAGITCGPYPCQNADMEDPGVANVLRALAICVVEDVDEEPEISLTEIEIFADLLVSRLTILTGGEGGPREKADEEILDAGLAGLGDDKRPWHAAVYKDGQRRLVRDLIQMLAEILDDAEEDGDEDMDGGGEGGDEENNQS